MLRIFQTARWPLIASVVACAALLAGSLAVPAMGGPDALSSASPLSLAKKALKKANQADKRSRKALRESQKVSAKAGTQGPPGAAGVPGANGAPGRDGFGSLTYVEGLGGTTSTADDYAVDAAFCPPGQAPTGGSFSPAGSELGGTDPALGDYGDVALDFDDPPDGYVDAWIAWVYNATADANVIATAVCAPAGSALVAARARPGAVAGSRAERLRELYLGR